MGIYSKCRVCGTRRKPKKSTLCRKCYLEHEGRLAIHHQSQKIEDKILKQWGLD